MPMLTDLQQQYSLPKRGLVEKAQIGNISYESRNRAQQMPQTCSGLKQNFILYSTDFKRKRNRSPLQIMHNDATKRKIKDQETPNREGKNSIRKLPNTAKEYNK